ncbi:MAG: XrtA system polysaccharide chain length determinant [Lysobacteraceae bacterium]|mgnify:CR=1 FL=1
MNTLGRLPGPGGQGGGGAGELAAELPVILREGRRLGLVLMAVFAAIALSALVVGLVWPKKFLSHATVHVGEDNIIGPLMEGRAVPTGVADRARMAREVVFSRRAMGEILEVGGWAGTATDPLSQERLIEEIKRRTDIGGQGANLVRISYHDARPERAQAVTAHFTELFIRESLRTKEEESREAYEFIAAQVSAYHVKLAEAEERLKDFRAANQEARPGTDVDVRTRVSELRRAIENGRANIAELQMRERALAQQLSGEAEISDMRSTAAQYRIRLAELNAQLDRLRLDYTDQYPDVVRLRHQIEDLQAALRREEASGSGLGATDAQINPLYQQLRADLARVRSDVAAMRARNAENELLLEAELERGRRVADSEAELAELTRDYEVNRDVYQDLLRRRENARVSMSLDAEQRGLTLRVQEPAALPLQPVGLRLTHFAVAGLGLGVAVPFGLLFAAVRLDPRPRSAKRLAEQSALPVLVSIPQYATRRDRRREWMRLGAGAVLVGLVMAAYLSVALSRGAVL